jgi:hypothetical protein
MPRALLPTLAALFILCHLASAQTPGEALNQPAWTWVNGDGSIPWAVVTGAEAHDGTAMRSGTLSANQTSKIKTTIAGPGTLSWWVKTSSEQKFDFLRLNMDGAVLAHRSGEVPWTRVQSRLPAGEHTIDWSFANDAAGVSGSNAAWLDEVAFTPLTNGPSMVAALDSGLPFINDSPVPWTGWAIPEAHAGNDCMISPRSANSVLRLQVNGPRVLSWWWRLEQLTGYEGAHAESTGSAPETGWTRVQLALYPGPHELRWKLLPDAGYGLTPGFVPPATAVLGGGLAVDQFESLPVSNNIGEALDNPNVTWTALKNGIPVTGSELLWGGLPAPYYPTADGVDAAVHGKLPADSTDIQMLTTTIQGPCLVRYKAGEIPGITIKVDDADAIPWRSGPLAAFSQYEVMIRRPGPHTFQFVPLAGNYRTALDMFEVISASTTLEEALDTTGMTWRITDSTGEELPQATADWQALTQNYSLDSALFDASRKYDTAGEDAVWLENFSSSRLATSVSGTGTLRYRTRGGTETTGAPLLFVDNAVASPTAVTDASGWVYWTLRITSAGTHALRWQTPASGLWFQTAISNVQYSPLSAVLPEEALDATGQMFTATNVSMLSDGGSAWSGGDAIEGICSTQNEPRVSTTLNGPMWMNFRWMRNGLACAPLLERAAGSSAGAVYLAADLNKWEECSVFFPAGLAAPVWRWAGQYNTMWLDAVSINAAGELAQASESEGICDAWQAEPVLWRRVTDVSFDGVDSIRMPPLAVGGTAVLRANFQGPGRVTWRSRTARLSPGQTESPTLAVTVTGGWHTQLGHPDSEQEDPWWLHEVHIGDPGPCRVTWTAADPGGNSGVWLDDFTFTPYLSVSTAAALDNNLTWTQTPSVAFQGFESPSAWDGIDQLIYTPVPGSAVVPVLQTTVTEGGYFSGRLRGLDPGQMNVYGKMRVTLNGSELLMLNLPGPGTWENFYIPVTSANTVVAIRMEGNTTSMPMQLRAALDDLSWHPGNLVGLDVALDTPGRVWNVIFPANGWIGTSGTGFADGVDGALCRMPGAELSTLLPGPASIRYRWKSATGGDTGYFRPFYSQTGAVEGPLRNLRNNGAAPAWRTEEYDWISASVQTVRWATSNAQSSDLQLDQVEVLTPPAVPLDQALDVPGTSFTVSDAAVVKGFGTVNTGAGNNVAAFILPVKTAVSTHWVQATLAGPKLLSWQSSEALAMTVDGAAATPVTTKGGQPAMRQYWLRLPSGTHTVRWSYTHTDYYNPKGILLDSLELSPEVSLADAVDQPGLTFTTTVSSATDAAWLTPATSAAPADGTDSAMLVLSAHNARGTLKTTVQGQYYLSFTLTIPTGSVLYARLFDNGNAIADLTNGYNRVPLPPGTHVLEWAFTGSPSVTAPIYVDGIALDSATNPGPVPAPSSLDWPGLMLTNGTLGSDAPDLRLGGAAALLTPPVGGKAGVDAAFSGPGLLSLWIKPGAAPVTVLADGAEIPHFTGPVTFGGWTEVRAWQPLPGSHRFVVQSTAAFAADSFSISAVSTVTPGTAGDTGGTLSLTANDGVTGLSHAGTTGSNGHAVLLRGRPGSLAAMSATVTGPASLEQWLLYWPQTAALTQTLDGAPLALVSHWSGSALRSAPPGATWTRYLARIPAGVHTLSWQVSVAAAATRDGDVWLDDARLIPDTSVSLAEALELPANSFTTGPASAWQGLRAPALGLPPDEDVALVTPGAGTAWLEATFTGAAWISVQTDYAPGSTVTALLDDQPLQGPWVPTAGLHRLRINFTGAATALSSVRIVAPLREMPVSQFTPAPAALYAADPADVWRVFEFPDVSSNIPSGIVLLNSRSQSSGNAPVWAEFNVPGPGIVSTFAAEYTFIDGRKVDLDMLIGLMGGTAVSGPGPHKVRWQWDTVQAAWPPVLRAFNFTPATGTLTSAFNVPGTTVTTGGDRSWSPLPAGETGLTGMLCAAPVLDPGELSWMEASVTGPGFLSFQWMAGGLNGTPRVWAELDGIPLDRPAEPYSWVFEEVPIPPGTHTVRWAVLAAGSTHGNTYQSPNPPLLLGNAAFRSSATVAAPNNNYAAALEASAALTFTTGSEGVRISSGNASAPDDFVELYTAPGHSAAWLQTTLTGPARVTFSSKGRLRVRDGADTLLDFQGGQEWSPSGFDLGSGSHTIRWEVPARSLDSTFGDWFPAVVSAGCLDALTVGALPAGDIPVQLAVDYPLAFDVLPWAGFRGQAQVTFDGTDALQSGEQFLQFSVAGPGVLSFRLRNVASLSPAPNSPAAEPQGPVDGNGWQLWRLPVTGRTRFESMVQMVADEYWYMDTVTFTPSTVTLAQALETSSLTWTTSAAAPWAAVTTGLAGDAADAAASAMYSGPSWIETTLPGPGTLQFHLQSAVPDPQYPPLVFSVDGVATPVAYLTQPKLNSIVITTPGTHKVRWTAGQAYGLTGDQVNLDRVSFTPLTGDESFPAWLALAGFRGTQNLPAPGPGTLASLAGYAFGFPPSGPDGAAATSRLPAASTAQANGQPTLALTWHQRRTDAGLTYIPEFGDSAGGFVPAPAVPVSVTPLDAMWERVTVIDPGPVAAAGRRFGRVRLAWREAVQP